MSDELHAADISSGALRRGLRLSVTASSLGMVFFAVILNMPFQMLLEALGASGFIIGLFGTIRQLALLAQIPGSLLMEHLKRRKVAWAVLGVIHRLLVLVPAWLAWRRPHDPDTVFLILAAIAVSFVIESLAAPAWTSWMADLVPPSVRGRFWGRRQAVVSIVSLVAIAGAGWLLDFFRTRGDQKTALVGFSLLLVVAAVFGVADILLHGCVPEPLRRPALPGRHWLTRIVQPLRHPSFRNLALSIGVWGFACTMAGSFNTIYLKRVFEASYTELSVVTICGTLGVIVFSVLAGYLVERMGARTLAVVVMCLAPLCSAVWFFVTATPMSFVLPLLGTIRTTQVVVLISAVSLVSGGIYSMLGVCHLSLLAGIAPKRERTLAMAVHMCVIGLLTAGGAVVGGRIVDFIDAHPTHIRLMGGTLLNYTQILHVLHAILIWTLAVPLMMRVRARREPLNVAEGFDRVVLVNPIRFAIGVYQAQVLSAPSRRKRRLQAAEAIGSAGAEITIADLIPRLDDPVIDVREAAALALGRIGGREAHAALLAKIDDPDNDLTLIALRALRFTPDRRLVDRLIAHLDDDEPYVVREVVRTLGACGDARAVTPLVTLLNRTPQGPLVAITAEVLGRLGDISALYVILPRFRLSATPAQRRALAVACGDLLGSPDGFYQLLTREERSVGAGVAHDLTRARRALLNPLLPLAWRQRRDLWRGLATLEQAVERNTLPQAARVAFGLAETLAGVRYGIARHSDTTAFLAALDRCDSRFTVGVWYLAVMNGAFARYDASGSLAPVRDSLEIQLVVHVVASWVRNPGRRRSRQAAPALSQTHAWRTTPPPENPAP
jgi:HEAT repeat protein